MSVFACALGRPCMNHSEVINNTSAKQTIQLHPGQHFFSKKKRAALGGTRTHDTLQSTEQSTKYLILFGALLKNEWNKM